MNVARLTFLIAFLMSPACGSKEDTLSNTDSYTVRSDLAVSNRVVLEFQQVFPYRSITIGESQTAKCQDFAKAYQATGLTLQPASLKLSHGEPERHCSRRNSFKQCENYQFVYRFSCQFQSN